MQRVGAAATRGAAVPPRQARVCAWVASGNWLCPAASQGPGMHGGNQMQRHWQHRWFRPRLPARCRRRTAAPPPPAAAHRSHSGIHRRQSPAGAASSSSASWAPYLPLTPLAGWVFTDTCACRRARQEQLIGGSCELAPARGPPARPSRGAPNGGSPRVAGKVEQPARQC